MKPEAINSGSGLRVVPSAGHGVCKQASPKSLQPRTAAAEELVSRSNSVKKFKTLIPALGEAWWYVGVSGSHRSQDEKPRA